MGYLSCNAESAISTCDPYNWDMKKKQRKRTKPQKSPNIRHFSYTHLESATAGFSPQNFLGRGSHGAVYKAVLDDGKLTVAVKKATSSTSATPLQEDNEIEILSKIRSPRLVNLLGFSLDSNEKKLIVVEFMPNGSLYDILHSSPRPPGWAKRVRFALQTAKAVETLHSSNPPVIHRDIKSSNVLVDGNWNARLGDFGLALRGHLEDVRIRCTPPAGTLGYLDPGYIAPENLSAKSDVFSFGILLLEIITGRKAIDVNYSPLSVIDWALPLIKKGEFSAIYDTRIGPPEDMSVMRRLAVLAARCVRSAPEKRPAMAEVVDCLRVVSKRVGSPIWNNLRRGMRKPLISVKQEVFDGSEEVVKNSKQSRTMLLRNTKVCSVLPGVNFGREQSKLVGDRSVRSKSIGSVREIKMGYETKNCHQLGLVRRKSGVALRIPVVRLSKSRSMGVLQTTRLVSDSERGIVFQLVKNPQFRGLDLPGLVITVDESPQNKILEGRQSMTDFTICSSSESLDQDCSNNMQRDQPIDINEGQLRAQGPNKQNSGLALMSNEELKIRRELEIDVEKDLEEEIKDGICHLALRLHRLYLRQREQNARESFTEVNITIMMERGFKIEINKMEKEAYEKGQPRTSRAEYKQGKSPVAKEFNLERSLRSGTSLVPTNKRHYTLHYAQVLRDRKDRRNCTSASGQPKGNVRVENKKLLELGWRL
ncbi:hypothetical protein HHK36_030719 [Tetracentron sinense]|uniref:Protein kinase domain-containing protein n=1 Tax=Tetracentron sinense TaxID=13715 RepID=A0A834YC71_TETSI|nr:hypothetical protein HHK36_030719 [Tetracentron sinense]